MSPPRTCQCMSYDCATCQSREYSRKTYRLKAYGQWEPKGDLSAVVAHLERLRLHRVGLNRISELTGLSRATVFRIRSGRNQWITRRVATLILAVQPDATLRLSGVGVSRRIRALMALGWSTYYLADRLDVTQNHVWELSAGRRWVKPETFAAIDTLYNELSMKRGPSKRTRTRALKAGYAPPLAFDNIDDPAETPATGTYHPLHLNDPAVATEYDGAAVARILSGDYKVPATAAVRRAVVAAWPHSLAELGRRTGWNIERYTSDQESA